MGSRDPQNDDCTADSVRPTIQLVKVLLCRYFGRAYRPHNDPFSELPLLISCGAFFHSLILLFLFFTHFFLLIISTFMALLIAISELCIGVQITRTLYRLICRGKSILERRHTRRLELTTNYSNVDKVSGN